MRELISRLGVFGGAFDPPHLAHQQLAEVAISQLQLDLLKIVPTGQAWHKTRVLTPPHHRLTMTRLAFEGIKDSEVDEREILRTGPSYTIDTLRELKNEYPQAELFLVMGQDQSHALTTWRDWQSIIELATIYVADRADLARDEAKFLSLKMPAIDISATAIRARIANQKSISTLVSPVIAGYIETHHLYLPT